MERKQLDKHERCEVLGDVATMAELLYGLAEKGLMTWTRVAGIMVALEEVTDEVQVMRAMEEKKTREQAS